MLSWLGAGCVLLASVGVFGQMRAALQQRTLELLSWLGAVRFLQSEMSYGLTPLPRICARLHETIGGAAGDFGRELSELLGRPGARSLPELWQELLDASAGRWHLLPEDVQCLRELGAGLGASGLAEQQRLLALAEQRLLALSQEAAERYTRLSRLLGGLGWCCGLLLICLWL